MPRRRSVHSSIPSHATTTMAEQQLHKIEEKLALAPKYGQNQAWLLLNSVLGDEDAGPKQKKHKPSHSEKHSALKVDMRLFEAVPKAVVPNIASVPKAKIPRRPRINWLNRSIALYLEFIGQDFLNLNSPASLFQEVKFNMSFCRCAIKAAVAHELEAFNNHRNAQAYHGSLTRQPPDLGKVDFDALSSLCQQYSQPVPTQHPQHADRAAPIAVDTTAQDVQGTHVVDAEGNGVSPAAAEDAANTCSECSAGTERPVAGSSRHLCAAGEQGSRSHELEMRCAAHRKLKRLREACEEEEGSPSVVKPFVDALFESDEDEPNGAVICTEQESAGQAPSNAAGEGAPGGSGSSGEKALCGATSVWTEVRKFVGRCLEPWIMSGAVNEEQSEVVMDKCVSKVLSAHAGRKDAGFLEAEGERIQGLVARYADHVVAQHRKLKKR